MSEKRVMYPIEKLLQMRDFLKDMGIESRINKYDRRLYILQIKNIEDEIKIVNKSSDLGLVFVKKQEPYYGPVDPFTCTREIVGFSQECYIEFKGDVE